MKSISNMLPTATRTASFTLFGVVPQDVEARYMRGEFINIKVPKLKNRTTTFNPSLIKPKWDSNPNESTFCFHNRSGVENVFVTADQQVYKTVHAGAVVSNVECNWCHLLIVDKPRGSPVNCITVNNEIPLFQTVGVFCDLRCVYADYLNSCAGMDRHATWNHTRESNIKTMYRLDGHKDELQAAPNYRLLQKNGGSLTPEQYKNKNYVFVSTGHYVTDPVKECYQRT